MYSEIEKIKYYLPKKIDLSKQVKKFKLFKGTKNAQIALSIGLILGHLVYLIWKYIFLIFIGAN